MRSYYIHTLSATNLRRCYEVAPPRVQQYLEAERDHAVRKITPGSVVLELGCGYGRIVPALAEKAAWVVGIDTSRASLQLGQELVGPVRNCLLLEMDAARLSFLDGTFDYVLCIQNGISAFHLDRKELLRESIRVTKPGGTLLFSSYAEGFWEDRLRWFEAQAEAGLIGEIDPERTRDGMIVCKDGFTASTVGPEEFLALASAFDVDATITEVDGSSLFCEIVRRRTDPAGAGL